MYSMKIIPNLLFAFISVLALFSSCNQEEQAIAKTESESFYPSSKPMTRWWWFATEIKEADVRHQLNWMKRNNFGGVEIAWVYPLYRYQRMYARSYNRHYPKDTTAQEWLSPEWSEIVSYTKKYADSIIVSIFVNPTQFGPNEDLDKYPRTLEADLKLLEDIGISAVLAPNIADVYGDGRQT